MASILDIAKKLNKEYKMDRLAIVADIKPSYERLPTGALGLDYPLFGGLPLGRICVFSGLQHSGKSTAACVALAAYQRRFPEKVCVYVDVEHSLDIKFQAAMSGIDMSKLLYIDPIGLSGEQICDLVIELQRGDEVGLVVLDSLPAMVPQAVLENDMTKDAGMRGTMAKKLYPFLAVMQSLVTEKNNILICINQVRDDGKTFTGIQKWKEPCGGAPQFYSSVSVRFGTRKFTKGDDMDACGAQNGEGADGFRLQFKIMKNKTAPCNRGGGFITFRYATGMDWLHDLLEIAIGFGFIPRVNNVTYQLVDLETGVLLQDENGRELKGKKADLIEYIKTNIPFQVKYLAMLNKAISNEDASYGSLLDARAAAEIDAQENAVSLEVKAAEAEGV
jgi:recombination protein RecA